MYVQFCNEAKSCAYWLVNETLWYETETRPRHLIFSPRGDRDRDLSTFSTRPRRDRDIWKLRFETVSKQRRRDRDYISAFVSNLQRVPVFFISKCSFVWHSAYFHLALHPSFCRTRKKSALNFPQISRSQLSAFRKIPLPDVPSRGTVSGSGVGWIMSER